jgi:hypothetical protein
LQKAADAYSAFDNLVSIPKTINVHSISMIGLGKSPFHDDGQAHIAYCSSLTTLAKGTLNCKASGPRPGKGVPLMFRNWSHS